MIPALEDILTNYANDNYDKRTALNYLEAHLELASRQNQQEDTVVKDIIEPSTRCTNCENKRGVWSKERTEQGYTGCIIKTYDELDINMAEIKAESVNLGWIKIHLGVLHEQIITRSVTSCKYFKGTAYDTNN